MEHELFQSKMKPSVDAASVSDIIRSSSSGLNPHRTAAIELILGRSIEERRERILAGDRFWSDPTPQPKRTSEAPKTPTPQVQSSAPAPAPQPPSESFLDDTAMILTGPASASTKYEGSQDSLAPLGSTNTIGKAARCEELPADIETKPSASEDFVELVCRICKIEQPRNDLRHGVYCGFRHPSGMKGTRMRCASCGTDMAYNADACTGCHGKFK
jgi:hypothetical protein